MSGLVFLGVAAVGWATGAVALLRRVAFLVPSLVLLIYVTTLLMYAAPGNPFANERAASPQVEATPNAHQDTAFPPKDYTHPRATRNICPPARPPPAF